MKPVFKPNVIIHGGAGSIDRAHLPPELYAQYRRSLLRYLTSTRQQLEEGANALDAAVHAVSLLEDDPLFNCGRGSVFNMDGGIEMEASLMVTNVFDDDETQRSSTQRYGEIQEKPRKPMGGLKKRAAAVSMVRETRHPISLAREVLLEGDESDEVRDMHCHLSGVQVESFGRDKGLEMKPREWFWTERRWKEHLRGLGRSDTCDQSGKGEDILPSQGTVGAVCLDRWGNLAVATSTGGLTNKMPGRIGDTPTVGAGFFAESWDEHTNSTSTSSRSGNDIIGTTFSNILMDCFPSLLSMPNLVRQSNIHKSVHRRAVAMSGTGNGDSFLRVCAVRSAAARCRYGGMHLLEAVEATAGRDGELEKSAGKRFGRTGEGEGGIIGIEIVSEGTVKVVFAFNCSGMWRAFYEGGEAKVMVFREEYK